MSRSDADRTVAAVAKALGGDHPEEIQRILASIAARAVEDEEAEIEREVEALGEAIERGEIECARCGKTLGQIHASVWTRTTGTVYYCHDNDGSCYVSATRERYPELRVTEERL